MPTVITHVELHAQVYSCIFTLPTMHDKNPCIGAYHECTLLIYFANLSNHGQLLQTSHHKNFLRETRKLFRPNHALTIHACHKHSHMSLISLRNFVFCLIMAKHVHLAKRAQFQEKLFITSNPIHVKYHVSINFIAFKQSIF